MRKGLTHEYLKELRETTAYILNDVGVGTYTSYSFIPWVILMFTVASSVTLITPIVALVASTILLATTCRFKRVKGLKLMVKPIIYITILALVVSSPILISNVNVDVYKFILRVIASTVIFTITLRLIGWMNIIKGLNIVRTPRELVKMIQHTVKFIPLFLTEVLKMLIAREARVLGKPSKRRIWKVLATIVSDVVLKSNYRAWKLSLALEARTLKFEPKGGVDREVNIHDAILLTIALTILTLEVAGRVWGGLLS